jgi:hypothetical protein
MQSYWIAMAYFLNDTNSIINSFYMQSLMNPNLAKSVGHIPLAYSKDDAAKLTDAFMVKLAREYMQAMGIENTQYSSPFRPGTSALPYRFQQSG